MYSGCHQNQVSFPPLPCLPPAKIGTKSPILLSLSAALSKYSAWGRGVERDANSLFAELFHLFFPPPRCLPEDLGSRQSWRVAAVGAAWWKQAAVTQSISSAASSVAQLHLLEEKTIKSFRAKVFTYYLPRFAWIPLFLMPFVALVLPFHDCLCCKGLFHSLLCPVLACVNANGVDLSQPKESSPRTSGS